MKLKLDENLGITGVERLRAAGHDASSVYEQRLASASDRTLIEVCRYESRALITLDLDFSNPLVYPPHEYAGIAVLRLHDPLTTSDILKAIDVLIAGLRDSSLQGKLWIVELGRIRVYQPEQ